MYDGASYFQARASEVRAAGLQILDPTERKRVLQIADDYDNLAAEAARGKELHEPLHLNGDDRVAPTVSNPDLLAIYLAIKSANSDEIPQALPHRIMP